MLHEWHEQSPGRIESMFTAMRNVVPSHLCDSNLFDFKSIDSSSGVINGGDLVFDESEIENNFEDGSKDSIKDNFKESNAHINELNVVEVK